MKPLNSMYDLEWAPRLMVEASAGTGKTYTIVGLFIRLLVEKKLGIDQILVMTFTKKATAELRERIFIRLREALNALEGNYMKDDLFLKELFEKTENRSEATQLLRKAIHDFDDAQVFTIHGFCQKVLSEHALLAGVPFDLDIIQHDDLLQQAAEDFWRVFMHNYGKTEAGVYYISKMLDIAKTPSELIKKLSDLFEKPYAKIEGEILDDPLHYLESVITLRKQIVDTWKADEKEITRILRKCDVSRFQQYLDSRLHKLIQFINSDGYSTDKPESLEYFRADYLYDPDNFPKSRKTEPTEEHRIFDLFQQYDELISNIDTVTTTLIHGSYHDIKTRREDLSSQSSAITYNDLLLKLEASLRDDRHGDRLANVLLRKYPYALVDEFQDTDPIQYSIFDSIYPKQGENTALMMIGDPKQAIYAFRGADVYTYFRARKDGVQNQYTLSRNYRSTPQLIEAVNHLFSGDNKPFLEDAIEFFPSEPGKSESENRLIIDDKHPIPFEIITREGLTSNKNDSREFAYNQTVKEIAELLEKAEKGEASIDGRKLFAGDIAVLIASHKDAAEMKRRLKKVGIDSVTYSNKKVFESYEAKRIAYLMEAVLHPFDRRAFSNGMLSGFFSLRMSKIYQYISDEEKRQIMSEHLRELRELWSSKGFSAMLRSIFYQDDRMAGLAKLENSERVLTNLFQLADICSQAEQSEGLDPAGLFAWYQKELTDPGKDDEKTLLLESDQNLVKISTIHNSKGLEYPVVFCPMLWEGREVKDKDLLQQYHESLDDDLTINIDQLKDERRAEAFEKSAFENLAEEVRKLYVAVTRAKYKCTVIWDTQTTSNISGLGSLLAGKEAIMEIIHDQTKLSEKNESDGTRFVKSLQELSEKSNGTIGFRLIDSAETRTNPVEWNRADEEQLSYQTYSGRNELLVQNQLVSFSSLAYKTAEDGEPDYDQILENYVNAITAEPAQKSELTIFTFPRGANPGTAIHKLFELEDFNFNSVQKIDLKGSVEDVLQTHNIDIKWADVAQKMLRDVSGALIPGLSLSDVSGEDQLREMEFHFPVKKPIAERLFSIIRKERPTESEQNNLNSMLIGFIDLIVRQNGKYYILDYKSNYLGDSLDDYSAEKLKSEMLHAGYDLQYHLYMAALAKYLRKRLPDFSYEKHIGGAAYLFVRGMRSGSDNGIWFHKPDQEIIEQLEKELEVL
ncbi:MAG: exodeoxyribonuclease V subunit beta [Balneolaceae bacterium]|nr:exodeoxyribonuclease V subunit beta [Balneolaceae bacterium]